MIRSPVVSLVVSGRKLRMTTAEPMTQPSLPRPPGDCVGAWLVWGAGAGDGAEWESLLLRATTLPGGGLNYLGRVLPVPEALDALRDDPRQVCVAPPACAAEAELKTLLGRGKGVVLVGGAEEARRWGECGPVAIVSPGAGAEALATGILSASACAGREARFRQESKLLQQRLQDRALLERAKGVLVQRLGVAEEEAYRRIRTLARRERRSLGEVARSVLDADGLLPAALTRNDRADEGSRA
jgi:hypothetical protein